jgi:putative transposase
MAQYQARWPISVMGEVLQGSRSGLYAYVQRQASADGGAEEAALLTRVQAIAAETRHTYGSRRMAKPLQDDGFAVGRYKARRLMRQAKLTVQRRKQRHPVTTDSRHGYTVAPKLLARQFAVAKPNQVWGGDIKGFQRTGEQRWCAARWPSQRSGVVLPPPLNPGR